MRIVPSFAIEFDYVDSTSEPSLASQFSKAMDEWQMRGYELVSWQAITNVADNIPYEKIIAVFGKRCE